MTQITHEGADDSGLQELAKEAGEFDVAATAVGLEGGGRPGYLRELAMGFAISAFEKVADPDLIRFADTIERYLRDGYHPPETAEQEVRQSDGSHAYIEKEDGSVEEV